jgi:uncharacterized protein (DUF1800 family)
MQISIKNLRVTLPLLFVGIFLISFTPEHTEPASAFPYKKAGLTERQAAAHLLDRFTYGATPDDVDEVVRIGLENWFGQQLRADLPDEKLDHMLSKYSTLVMSNEEIIRTFPKGAQLRRMAIRDSAIHKNDVNKENRNGTRQALADYMREHGYRRERELYSELIAQKILRASYSSNQLREMLVSFWFNHFNVSLTDNDCSRFITAYERDVIRPNALGNFETMLLATAKSPAMLTYLDNFRSSTASDTRQPIKRVRPQNRAVSADSAMTQMAPNKNSKANQGLNENYAREIMELHTLGVDGGYTQKDVTEVARIFTGWTIYPVLNEYGKKQMANNAAANLSRKGFLRDGDFLFAANRHDKGEKVVMDIAFPAGGGYEEGVRLIKMLAHHPATARFISSKLANRFVSDAPPHALVDRMAKVFISSNGDIKQVLTALVSSPEFWSKEAVREKIKSPFELAISSVRSLNATITDPQPLYGWIVKMGEKVYSYQAPTGFPDKGQFWINTGSLLMRMNFGLALASERIAGLKINLPELHQNREPESPEEALAIYSRRMMPERNLDDTMERLIPALNDPDFSEKVDSAANNAMPANKDLAIARGKGKRDVLAQVVGIVIGSPEFQRR